MGVGLELLPVALLDVAGVVAEVPLPLLAPVVVPPDPAVGVGLEVLPEALLDVAGAVAEVP